VTNCRTALVTGGTSGLGFAMAAALVRAGVGVAVAGRSGQRAAEAADRIGGEGALRGEGAQGGEGALQGEGAQGGKGALQGEGALGGGGAFGVELDVRDESSVARAIGTAWERLGGIDLLVNNAGIGMRTVNPAFMTEPRGFWTVSPQAFRDLIATNLTGYFLVAREITPRMLAAGRGRIVNISVSESTMTRAGFVPYGPSRAGSEALTRVMAADLRGTGITVNTLLPGGATRTGMVPDEEIAATLLEPEIMGPPIVWLASAEAAGANDERVVAAEFAEWLDARRSG
jgi:NAD(P)-dependent dehydrogenase (short-subunit alcohol dehydrogenase family)